MLINIKPDVDDDDESTFNINLCEIKTIKSRENLFIIK